MPIEYSKWCYTTQYSSSAQFYVCQIQQSQAQGLAQATAMCQLAMVWEGIWGSGSKFSIQSSQHEEPQLHNYMMKKSGQVNDIPICIH